MLQAISELPRSTEKASAFIKKETLAQVFSCEFCKIFKNTFFTEHLRTTASVCWRSLKFEYRLLQ